MYLRKSRKDLEAEKNGEGETLAKHKRILTNFAEKQGLYIDHIYEEVVSGDTIAARPEVKKMIEDCYAGKYRGILVVDPDRLGRGNQADMQTFLDCFKYSNNRNGLLVVTPTKTYDVAHNSDDERYMEFVMFFARQEYKTIRERYERGKKQSIVEGNYMGSYRPYGYQIHKTKTSRTLVQDPDEAPIVKKIFDWKVNYNMTPGAIERKLTALGVPTYKNGAEWSKETVTCILQNPTYCGKVRYNDRMQVKILKNGELVTSRPRSNHTSHYMEYDVKHKEQDIVSEELFKEAQIGFSSDKTKANLALQNPLAGLVVCKNCGFAMHYQGYTTRPTFQPRLIHRQSQVCNVKSAFFKDIVSATAYGLQQKLEDFEMEIDNAPEVDEDEINIQLRSLEKEKQKIEQAINKISEAFEEGTYTSNEFLKEQQNAKKS